MENWETLEEEHSNALTGCMEALESAILRVPVTGGARVRVPVLFLLFGYLKFYLLYHSSVNGCLFQCFRLHRSAGEHVRVLLSFSCYP